MLEDLLLFGGDDRQELAKQANRSFLVLQPFGMLQRQVEKNSLNRSQWLVEAKFDAVKTPLKRFDIEGEGPRRVAIDISRKLVG